MCVCLLGQIAPIIVHFYRCETCMYSVYLTRNIIIQLYASKKRIGGKRVVDSQTDVIGWDDG
jgi:hypothetical protein